MKTIKQKIYDFIGHILTILDSSLLIIVGGVFMAKWLVDGESILRIFLILIPIAVLLGLAMRFIKYKSESFRRRHFIHQTRRATSLLESITTISPILNLLAWWKGNKPRDFTLYQIVIVDLVAVISFTTWISSILFISHMERRNFVLTCILFLIIYYAIWHVYLDIKNYYAPVKEEEEEERNNNVVR